MKKILLALLVPLACPAAAISSELSNGRLHTMNTESPRQLPYEMVISNECPYSYDGLSKVVERVFKRSGVNPLWDNDSIADGDAMYLDIRVHCISTADSNKSYATQVLFSRYNSSPAFYDGDFGRDGYGSDRFFKSSLSESVEDALRVFLKKNSG